MKRNLATSATAIAALVLVGTAVSHATPILPYEFTSTHTEVPTQTGLTYSALTRTNLSFSTSPGTFNSGGWNLASEVDTTEYVEFTLTPETGYELNLTQISFDSQRSNTGPVFGEVRYSVDGYASGLTYTTTPLTEALGNNIWDFPDVYNATTPVTFRFYGYGATGSLGTLKFDNVAVTGEVLEGAQIAGDFNGDGKVNLADYTVWRDNLGGPESVFPDGTGDSSGLVDTGDYNTWKTSFGTGSEAMLSTTQAANVPEPATVVLLATFGLLVAARYRFR
ncbi:hypothetical protein [Aeoliella sp. SH292]|uniref:hypothetical protein n=1 Tax=Aeoliella sp. SH292 TaxID=3454464 RepID=UPI003F9A3F33